MLIINYNHSLSSYSSHNSAATIPPTEPPTAPATVFCLRGMRRPWRRRSPSSDPSQWPSMPKAPGLLSTEVVRYWLITSVLTHMQTHANRFRCKGFATKRSQEDIYFFTKSFKKSLQWFNFSPGCSGCTGVFSIGVVKGGKKAQSEHFQHVKTLLHQIWS